MGTPGTGGGPIGQGYGQPDSLEHYDDPSDHYCTLVDPESSDDTSEWDHISAKDRQPLATTQDNSAPQLPPLVPARTGSRDCLIIHQQHQKYQDDSNPDDHEDIQERPHQLESVGTVSPPGYKRGGAIVKGVRFSLVQQPPDSDKSDIGANPITHQPGPYRDSQDKQEAAKANLPAKDLQRRGKHRQSNQDIPGDPAPGIGALDHPEAELYIDEDQYIRSRTTRAALLRREQLGPDGNQSRSDHIQAGRQNFFSGARGKVDGVSGAAQWIGQPHLHHAVDFICCGLVRGADYMWEKKLQV